MPWHSIPLEESLPCCEKGDLFPVGEIKLLEMQTSPPDYLTEAELITLMEKHGIGRYLLNTHLSCNISAKRAKGLNHPSKLSLLVMTFQYSFE